MIPKIDGNDAVRVYPKHRKVRMPTKVSSMFFRMIDRTQIGLVYPTSYKRNPNCIKKIFEAAVACLYVFIHPKIIYVT